MVMLGRVIRSGFANIGDGQRIGKRK